MNISYANKRIQKSCVSISAMKNEFGDERAQILNVRIQQLQEAVNLEQLMDMPGKWHPLSQNRFGQFSAALGRNYRLIVEPDSHPAPLKSDGGIDWNAVTSVKIIEIVDYH